MKDQKFGILDAPRQQDQDLVEALGVLGASMVYLDIDHFKSVNTEFTERVVDKTVLPQFQRLVEQATRGHGFAYAEGGDEVVLLLPNASLSMAVALASDLANLVRSTPFEVESKTIRLTISAGVACCSSPADLEHLGERANLAKRQAKEQGRDRVSIWTASGCKPVGSENQSDGGADSAPTPQPGE